MTNKQELFILEYQKDFNATRAAVAVGYSPKTAYSQGQRLLKDPYLRLFNKMIVPTPNQSEE